VKNDTNTFDYQSPYILYSRQSFEELDGLNDEYKDLNISLNNYISMTDSQTQKNQ